MYLGLAGGGFPLTMFCVSSDVVVTRYGGLDADVAAQVRRSAEQVAMVPLAGLLCVYRSLAAVLGAGAVPDVDEPLAGWGELMAELFGPGDRALLERREVAGPRDLDAAQAFTVGGLCAAVRMFLVAEADRLDELVRLLPASVEGDRLAGEAQVWMMSLLRAARCVR